MTVGASGPQEVSGAVPAGRLPCAPALCVCRADPGLRAGAFVADMRAANYSGSGSLSLSVCELRFDYFFITKLNVFSYLSRYIKSL